VSVASSAEYRRKHYQKNKATLNAKNKAYRLANPDIISRIQRDKNWRKFGLKPADYFRILEEQGGGCAICGAKTPRRNASKYFHVDHDHATGHVRGLLCNPCNIGIAALGESEDVMTRAIKYLKETSK
jgi:hypothetical protein